MATIFDSIEAAKERVLALAGLDLQETQICPVEGLRVVRKDTKMVLEDPWVPANFKALIQAKINTQQGFKFIDANGKEIRFVVAPSSGGYRCWLYLERGPLSL